MLLFSYLLSLLTYLDLNEYPVSGGGYDEEVPSSKKEPIQD